MSKVARRIDTSRTGVLAGRVAYVTGAGRGQGRDLAVRFAREGADLVVSDVCSDIASVRYPVATSEGLQETVRLVGDAGARCGWAETDVRSQRDLDDLTRRAIDELGRIHVLLQNRHWDNACPVAPIREAVEVGDHA